MRIAIIPARGGSKRIKDKNIVDFCGKPMISYALEAARASGLFDVIHVSTDSERIAAVADDLGFPVAFLRDPSMAGDHTPLMPVLRWVLERFRDSGRERSEEHTSELQSLMRISYAVFCLKKKKQQT